MIFSINQTFQHILASIAQGGCGWSSTPPKFALDQTSPLISLQRPPVGGTDPVGNHCFGPFWIRKLSDKCLPIRTLLCVSFKHNLISLASFKGTPNSMRILYSTFLLTESLIGVISHDTYYTSVLSSFL
jgi:hypothetical protein